MTTPRRHSAPRRPSSLAAPAAVAAALLALGACAAPGSPAQTAAPALTPTAAAMTPTVFFTQDSALLDGPALAVVDQAAAIAARNPGARVLVRGFAGPAGSAAFNDALSEARARAVADALRERGVARERIAVEPRGPVPFDLIPTESRRVEVVVGG